MDLFTVVEDEFVILRVKGVFRQEKLFKRGERFYAKYGTGFVRLLNHGNTSVPDVKLVECSIEI